MHLLTLMYIFGFKFFASSFKSLRSSHEFARILSSRTNYRIRDFRHFAAKVSPIKTTSSTDKKSTNELAVVNLEKGKARLFQDGNPLVYGGAIKNLEGNPQSGDLVSVKDHMGNLIGKGVYNSNSTYRVRMFTRSYEQESALDFDSLLKLRIEQALALRKRAGLPSEINTAFRAIK